MISQYDNRPAAAVLHEIFAERAHQDRKWGGPEHDDLLSDADFRGFIFERLSIDAGGDERRKMVEIAALAVANIERIDRWCGVSAPAVPPYQMRAIEERRQLEERLIGLVEYLYGKRAVSELPDLPPAVRLLMRRQVVLMEKLIEVLSLRIGLFEPSVADICGAPKVPGNGIIRTTKDGRRVVFWVQHNRGLDPKMVVSWYDDDGRQVNLICSDGSGLLERLRNEGSPGILNADADWAVDEMKKVVIEQAAARVAPTADGIKSATPGFDRVDLANTPGEIMVFRAKNGDDIRDVIYRRSVDQETKAECWRLIPSFYELGREFASAGATTLRPRPTAAGKEFHEPNACGGSA